MSMTTVSSARAAPLWFPGLPTLIKGGRQSTAGSSA